MDWIQLSIKIYLIGAFLQLCMYMFEMKSFILIMKVGVDKAEVFFYLYQSKIFIPIGKSKPFINKI